MAKRIVATTVLAVAVIGAGYFLLVAPAKVDAGYNRAVGGAATAINKDVTALH